MIFCSFEIINCWAGILTKYNYKICSNIEIEFNHNRLYWFHCANLLSNTQFGIEWNPLTIPIHMRFFYSHHSNELIFIQFNYLLSFFNWTISYFLVFWWVKGFWLIDRIDFGISFENQLSKLNIIECLNMNGLGVDGDVHGTVWFIIFFLRNKISSELIRFDCN